MQIFTGDIQTEYEEAGHGTPLVLVHGLGSSLRFWDPVVADLAKHHRVIRYDLRGFGASEKPLDGYTLAGFANDLAALLDALEVDRAHVVGLSLGGVIAQRLALDHPTRLRSLIVCGTSSEVGEKATAFWLRLADLVERHGINIRITDATRSFAPAFAAQHPEMVRAYSAPGTNVGHSYAGTARAVSAYNWTMDLARVTIPSLILQGLEDQLTPPGGAVRMSRALRGSRLLMIPEAGHFLPVEQPVLFCAAILSFTGAVDQRSIRAEINT